MIISVQYDENMAPSTWNRTLSVSPMEKDRFTRKLTNQIGGKFRRQALVTQAVQEKKGLAKMPPNPARNLERKGK